MKKNWLMNFLFCGLFLMFISFPVNAANETVEAGGLVNNWVGTWAASQYNVDKGNMPPTTLTGNTLRQIIRVSIPGKQVRLKLSNECGKEPLTLNSVHMAQAEGNSSIKYDTDKVLTFDGKEAVTIPPGQTVISDTLNYNLEKLTNMAITINFGNVPTALTGHAGSRTTSYIQEGNKADEESLPGSVSTDHWYFITAIDVLSSGKAVVAFGDSITDGRGTTTNENNRWTDFLASRLQENPATSNVGVLNQGIGGNAIFGGLGPAGVKRFSRDALEQTGARYIIMFEGINDIGWGQSGLELVTKMTNAYQDFINKAHEKNIRVYGATILPCGGSSYYSDIHEQIRQAVNDWIKTSGQFDGVVDFDAALRDPNNETKLLNTYDGGDHLHPNPVGYKKMGEAIDLKLFSE